MIFQKTNKQPKMRLGQISDADVKVWDPNARSKVRALLEFILFLPFTVFKSLWLAFRKVVALPFMLGERIIQLLNYDVIKTKKLWVLRRYRLFSEQSVVASVVIIFSLVLFTGFVYANNMLALGLSLKGQVLGEATEALGDLNAAREKVLQNEVEQAVAKLELSEAKFERGLATMRGDSILFSTLSRLLPQGQDATRLLFAGQELSGVAVEVADIYSQLSLLKFGENGLEGGSTLNVDILQARVSEITKTVEEVLTELQKVDPQNLPTEYRDKFAQALTAGEEFENSLPALKSLLIVASDIFSGQHKLLMFLQNSNELRPTGGFMGTYGFFILDKAYIQNRTISSIYDLDGQLKEKYLPPLPVLAVNPRWYLRDSNWFYNFPDSAEVMADFYHKITGQRPDTVVAITPQVVLRLLEITGGIEVPEFGITLDKDNFIERTQLETSVFYDRDENKPKKLISDFFPLFLAKVSTLDSERKALVFKTLLESFSAKDIQFFSFNDATQKAIVQLGWHGGAKVTDRDYVAVVSSNLGGTKTDLSIETRVSLESKVSSSGKVLNKLSIFRKNPLPNTEGLENKSFLRVYLPLGSKLLTSEGFDTFDLNPKQLDDEEQEHPAVAGWEAKAVKTVNHGILVGEEGEKAYFGGWVFLEGGENRTLTFEYELPFTLQNNDRLSLVVDKQGGVPGYTFTYKVSFPGREIAWGSVGEEWPGDNFETEFIVNRPRFVGMVLD